MTVHLSPEHERLINEAVGSGAYRNADDVIARALDVLRSEDTWQQELRGSVEDKIERAFAQFEHGDCFSAEESRGQMEMRKAHRLAEQPNE